MQCEILRRKTTVSQVEQIFYPTKITRYTVSCAIHPCVLSRHMIFSQVYSQYRDIDNPVDKEKQLYKILPLFCKNCAKYSGHELVSKFPEAFDFAEGVSLLFVRHVTQLAQASNPARYHSQCVCVCVCGVFLLKIHVQ